jgi:hypothetical protein
MGNSNKSNFKENLILTVIGIILTSILGSGLTYWFTYRQWQYAIKQQIMETRVREARETLLKTMQLCQNRWFSSQRLVWACETPVDFDVNELRQKYIDSVREWNLNLYPQRILVAEYFGNDCANLFVDDAIMNGKITGTSVHTSFFKFHKEVMPWLHDSTTTISSTNVDQMRMQLNIVGKSLRVFYKTMSDKYQSLQEDYLVQ